MLDRTLFTIYGCNFYISCCRELISTLGSNLEIKEGNLAERMSSWHKLSKLLTNETKRGTECISHDISSVNFQLWQFWVIKNYLLWMSIIHKILSMFLLNYSIIFFAYFANSKFPEIWLETFCVKKKKIGIF